MSIDHKEARDRKRRRLALNTRDRAARFRLRRHLLALARTPLTEE